MAIDFDQALDAPEPELSAGMNITPLIDVLLVLLVMLIITIPIRLQSVNMELPSAVPPVIAVEPPVVRIEVTAQNSLLWDGEPLADRAMLAAYAKNTFMIDPLLVECAEADLQGVSV